MAPRWFSFSALIVLGCGGSQHGASFSGSHEQRVTTAAEVGTVEGTPRGYERLGRVSASCKVLRDYTVLNDEPFANVDCSEERLDRALRERAAAVGGELLVKRECRRTLEERSCEARVARPSDETLAARRAEAKPRKVPAPAPGPAEVARLDEPNVSKSWGIKLTFEARVPYDRPATPAARLVRKGEPAAQFEPLGDMEARCEPDQCEHSELEHALNVAAGRVGAAALSDVRCFDDQRGRACVGSVGAADLP